MWSVTPQQQQQQQQQQQGSWQQAYPCLCQHAAVQLGHPAPAAHMPANLAVEARVTLLAAYQGAANTAAHLAAGAAEVGAGAVLKHMTWRHACRQMRTKVSGVDLQAA
jgi:hypothetical protein